MASSASIRAGHSDLVSNGGDLRQNLIVGVLVFLSAALPLLSYPLALFPQGWVAERFNLRLPWPEIASVLLIAMMVFRGAHPFQFRIPTSGLALALFGLLFAQTVSALLADSPTSQYIWMLRAVCLVWLALVAAHFLTPAGLKTMAGVWALSAAVQAAIMIAQECAGIEPVGTIGNRNFAAGYLALSLPLGVAAIANRASQFPKLAQAWLIWCLVTVGYGALLLVAMIMAESRGAIAALVLVAGVWQLSKLPLLGRLTVFAVLATLVAVLAMNPAFSARAASVWNQDVRPSIWTGSLEAVAESPLVGHGPGSFLRVYPAHRPAEYFTKPKAAPVTDHAHNELIELAVEIGLFGLAAFIGILLFATQTARSAVCCGTDNDLKRLALGMSLGLAALFCQNLVDINLRMPPNQALFWLGLGWLAAARSAALPDSLSSSYSLRRFTRLAAGAVAMFILALGVVRPIAADVIFRQALIAQNAGNLQKAQSCFLATTAFDTDRIEAWRQLALVSHNLGQRELALEAMRFAHDLAPDYANLNGELASLLAMNGRLSESAALFARATQLYPFDATNFAKLARIFLTLHHPQQAHVIWEHARKLDPQNPVVRSMEQDFR